MVLASAEEQTKKITNSLSSTGVEIGKTGEEGQKATPIYDKLGNVLNEVTNVSREAIVEYNKYGTAIAKATDESRGAIEVYDKYGNATNQIAEQNKELEQSLGKVEQSEQKLITSKNEVIDTIREQSAETKKLTETTEEEARQSGIAEGLMLAAQAAARANQDATDKTDEARQATEKHIETIKEQAVVQQQIAEDINRTNQEEGEATDTKRDLSTETATLGENLKKTEQATNDAADATTEHNEELKEGASLIDIGAAAVQRMIAQEEKAVDTKKDLSTETATLENNLTETEQATENVTDATIRHNEELKGEIEFLDTSATATQRVSEEANKAADAKNKFKYRNCYSRK